MRRSIALLAIALAATMATDAWGQSGIAIEHDVGNVRFGVFGAGHLASDVDTSVGLIFPNFAYPASDANARQYLRGHSGILVARGTAGSLVCCKQTRVQ